MASRQRVSRRFVIQSFVAFGAASLLAACAPSAPPSPTAAPAAPTAAAKPAAAPTQAPAAATQAATQAPAPTSAPAAPKPTVAAPAPTATPGAAPGADLSTLKQVPRAKTWISVGVGGEAPQQFSDVAMHNPFLPGISRSGYQVVMEPLFYYNAYYTDTVCGLDGVQCKNGEMPWIGTDYKFTPDFKSV